jgi:hypothetical protein
MATAVKCNSPRPTIRSTSASKADSEQDLLTDNDKIYRYTSTDGSTVKLTITQQNVYITNGYAFTLLLPSVSEARNLSYTITVSDTGAAVTLTDRNGDSTSWGGDYTLDTAGDNITLQSNGSSWTVVTNNIAA